MNERPRTIKNILVVDNNPVILKLLAEFLSHQGYSVLTARDGLAALEILKETLPDLIIVDLVMPNIGGEQLCRILRARPELKTIRIVIYSAIEAEEASALLAIGADAYIAKGPFRETERHLNKVLAHIGNNTLSDLSGMILGGDNLCNRQIISELIFSRRHYENIFDTMPEGIVEFTTDWRIFHINAKALHLCGQAEENLLGSHFLNLFSAGDQGRLQALLAGMNGESATLDESRPVSLNIHEIAITLLPIHDDTHEFVVAIMRDLSEKITTAKELERLRRQQERILNTVSEGIFGLDTKNHISFVNPAAHSMLGYKPQDLIGQRLENIIPLCSLDEEGKPLAACCPISAADQEEIMRTGTETFRRKNGSTFPVRYTRAPIIENGKNLGAVISFADITERRKWEETLKEAVITDELTGLFNRRGFLTMADKLMEISAREHTDLLLFYLDFDNMKWINDNFGHATGDRALVETTELLRDTFRQADVIGRIGGDEFVVLCTDNASLGDKTTMLQRLTENIDKTNKLSGRPYPLALSFGLAHYKYAHPCSMDELLSQADKAMYINKEEKKKSGRGSYGH
jgi:diguanylate cyclase (GGDEF)-like protein/PAS domain S-box-containing protein